MACRIRERARSCTHDARSRDARCTEHKAMIRQHCRRRVGKVAANSDGWCARRIRVQLDSRGVDEKVRGIGIDVRHSLLLLLLALIH